MLLPALAFVIGAIGLGLTLAFARLVLQANRSINVTKRYRSKAPGLADLLNYGAIVDDGVIACKNGALLAAWEYQGDDQASLSDEECDLVSHRINQAILRLGSGCMFHVDCIREPATAYAPKEGSRFPDPISGAIDEERRRAFETPGNAFSSRYVLTVTHLTPGMAARKAGDLMFDDDAPPPSVQQVAQGHLARFKRDVQALETRLSGVVRLERLRSRPDGTDALLEHLNRCVSGKDHPVRLPKTPVLLDSLIGGQEFWSGTVAKIGRHYVQCVAVEGFPAESSPGILTALSELPLAYRWSTRWIFLDSWEALSHLERFRRKWAMQILPLIAQVLKVETGNINKDAQAMDADATDAKQGVSSGKAGAGYYTSVVVLMNEDRLRLEEETRQVEKVINNLGFVARVESVNTVDAFLGSLPGHGVENVRQPILNTMNLADLLPVSFPWMGRDRCPCPPPLYPAGSPPLAQALSTGQTPFCINLHVQDLAHLLVFGPSKTGKSTLLAFLIISFLRYPRMTLWTFDKGNSLYCLCQALGGNYYAIAADDCPLCFCPLQYLSSPSDQAWALSWLELILELNGVRVSPDQQNEIADVLRQMHCRGQRSLSDFCSAVQDQAIQAALRQYTVKGAFGRLFDAEEDGLAGFGALTVFEMQEAYGLDEKFRLPLLWYLFRRIERSLTGQPAAVIIDEASNALDNPFFKARLKTWLREMRKANCAVALATQGLGDATDSGIFGILNENTASKIYLPNPAANKPDAYGLYERLGLNPVQINLIATATPKQDYYLVNEDGCRLFDLALGPLALAFCAVSDKDSVAEVRRLIQTHGEGWIEPWLASRGLSVPAGAGTQQPNLTAFASV